MSDMKATPPRMILCRLCGREIHPEVDGARVLFWVHNIGGKQNCR